MALKHRRPADASPKQSPIADDHQFRALADLMPQLAWMAHPDGHIFWYNQRWYEYTGSTAEEMEGWGWQSVHHPDELPGVLTRWKASINTGSPFDMEFPLRGADGLFRWFLTRVTPVRDAKGKIIRWFGTNTDVDEFRRTQEALRKSETRLRISEEHLRLTQKAARIGSWELRLDTEEYVWSEEVFEMLGLSRVGFQPTLKSFLSMLYFSTDRENVLSATRAASKRSKNYNVQFRIARPDGQVRWIEARGKAFFNQGENLILGVFIDITETREAINESVLSQTRKRDESDKNPRKRKSS